MMLLERKALSLAAIVICLLVLVMNVSLFSRQQKLASAELGIRGLLYSDQDFGKAVTPTGAEDAVRVRAHGRLGNESRALPVPSPPSELPAGRKSAGNLAPQANMYSKVRAVKRMTAMLRSSAREQAGSIGVVSRNTSRRLSMAPGIALGKPSLQPHPHQGGSVKGGETAVTGSDAGGYVLAVDHYEQQTMGSRNLIQLQCYARHLNLSVVKPVMKDSFLRTPLDKTLQQDWIPLEESFDLEEWQANAKRAGYAPLMDWKEFLSKAPRDVVLCQFNYPSLSVINSRKKSGEPVTRRAQGEGYKVGCKENWPTRTQVAFLTANGFKVVRRVCFNFYNGDTLTREEFDRHLIPEGSSSKVTIVMDLWRGMGSSQRVLVQDKCSSTYPFHEYIQPSQQLVREAEMYVRKHLSDSPYIAVMGRLEMALLTVRGFSLPGCFGAILADLHELQKRTHLNGTFLSIDVGQYGTKKWRGPLEGEMMDELDRFLDSVYGEKVSVAEWEATFESVSSHRDAGYIGLLQKVIVSRARCILFAGGGAFQRHALHLYRQLNTTKEDCLAVVKSCTNPTKLAL